MLQVSVIIPFHNPATYLEQAVMSALDQKEVGEVILVNDASSDGSLDIAQQLREKFPQVKVINENHLQPKGPAYTRNLGVECASYPLIAFLDADDFYLKDRFTWVVGFMENNPVYDAVYLPTMNKILEGERADQNFAEQNELIQFDPRLQGEKPLENFLRSNSTYHLGGVLVRKKWIEKYGGFDSSLHYAEDNEFHIRIAKYGTPKFLYGKEEVKTIRRVHRGNMSYQLQFYNRKKLYHKHIDILDREDISLHAKSIFALRYLIFQLSPALNERLPIWLRRSIQSVFLLGLFVKRPRTMTRIVRFWLRNGLNYNQLIKK